MANYYIPLTSDVGIQRDGTAFDSTLHSDGSWTRFYRNRPQKIGGAQLIANGNDEIVRAMYSYDADGFSYYYLGRQSTLSFLQIFSNLTSSPETDCTPNIDFTSNANNNWTFDSIAYVPVSGDGPVTYMITNVSSDLLDIGDLNETPLYYGVLGDSAAFQPVVDTSTSVTITTAGGVVCIGSFIVIYGSNGFAKWNDGSEITEWPTDNFSQLGTSKFVYGATVRSGQTGSALLWSLNSVATIYINPNYAVGDNTDTAFLMSYVSTRSTLLSSKCVVSFDPYFYWVGTDSFWMYNGSVQELPNDVNKDWFFENINPNERGKTFAFAITKWNEVWFCFCKGDVTEPNWAVVYNIQTGKWYDTNQINRSSGLPSGSVVPYPVLTSSVPVRNGGTTLYPLYLHEIGTDLVQFNTVTPIVAYITSKTFNLWEQNPQAQVLDLDTVIMDVKQNGYMYFYVNYQGYPNSTVRQTYNFPFTQTDQFLNVRVKGSIFTITFVSNVIGGNFVMGKTMLYMKSTDDQRPGPTS